MKKQLNIILLACGLLCGSCLDKTPDNAIEADKALNTVEAANQAVIGIYSSFLGSGLHSGYLSLLPDLQADLFYAINGYSNAHGDIWRWEIMPTNGEIETVYGSLYGLITQCDFLLNHEKDIRATIDNDDDEDRMDQFCGEAYMARAIATWELIRLFTKAYDPATASQELGIVINDEYDTKVRPHRATLQESIDHLIADIEKAQELLSLEEDMTPQTVAIYDYEYFTEYAAHALRARLALYMGDWDEAIKWSSKVIDSGFFLLSSPQNNYYSGSLNDLEFLWQYDGGTEVIWKVGYTETAYGYSTGSVFWNYDFYNIKPDYVPAQWVLNLYDDNDMRGSVYYQLITTSHTHGLKWPLFYKLFGNQELMRYNVLHTSMPKVFRLAEQYLIRAEAYAKKGDYIRAGRDITTLRAARYSAYGATTMTADNAMKIIEEERVKELIGEGFRLTDLKRWHKGFARTPQSESLSNGSRLNISADNPLFVWPIPQHELEAPGADILPNESNK